MSQKSASPLADLLLRLVPEDGATIGNKRLGERFEAEAAREGYSLAEGDFETARQQLLEEGVLAKGKGRGGSVRRAEPDPEGFALAAQEPEPADEEQEAPKKSSGGSRRQGKTKQGSGGEGPRVLSYRHGDKRKNNPHVGLVDAASDAVAEPREWRYDPHLDPALQFDSRPERARIDELIDEALASGDEAEMRAALEQLKRMQEAYLEWTGKAERTSFDVDTVSLHVHERIDPMAILEAVRKERERSKDAPTFQQEMFGAPFENLAWRDAIDFYRHEKDWANRLIAGDSLQVMNSLIEKESMAGQVQMIYIDPPYGIRYGSNFQPFVDRRNVTDRKDEDLTQEPEMIKAFRDTWELGIHSYLTYLRDRLLLAHDLLADTGSIFVQISDENVHHVREILDEVFGAECHVCDILVKKKGSQKGGLIDPVNDYLLWYGRSPRESGKIKFHPLYQKRELDAETLSEFKLYELPGSPPEPVSDATTPDGESFDYRLSPRRIHQDYPGARLFRANPLTSGGVRKNQSLPFTYRGRQFNPGSGNCWKATAQTEDESASGMERLALSGRLVVGSGQIRFKSYLGDFGYTRMTNWWDGLGGASNPLYVVQTNDEIVQRCLLMTTDPGDLVLDPTCGAGTTAYVAEKWGRRWITCDTSRVAVTLAKQRLMTASFDYYALRYPEEGLKGGFRYKKVPHLTLQAIANNPEIEEIHAARQPAVEQALAELNAALAAEPPAEPFAVAEGYRQGRELDFADGAALEEWEVPYTFPEGWPEAARAPFEAFHQARRDMQEAMDASIANHAEQETLVDDPEVDRDKLRITGPFTVEAVPFPTVKSLAEAERPAEADESVARSGETARQAEWRDELMATRIRGKGGKHMALADLEAVPGLRHIHARGTLADTGEAVAVSFGPAHAALEQRQVEMAKKEAEDLFPVPKVLVFAAFAFDPEAAKDIDAIRGITALKAQMNTDLLTEDLKKKRASNESFWLIGQPDVEVRQREDGYYEVEVNGFDYFDAASGELESGGKDRIALWELDTDYDERSLLPRQVFFPMAGKKDGWYRLRKDLRVQLDEDRLAVYQGTVSLPFEAGDHAKIAVKIVDDRGVESLKVVPLG